MPTWSAGKRSNQFLISIYYYCHCCCCYFHSFWLYLTPVSIVCWPSVFVAYVFMIRIRLLSSLLPYRRGGGIWSGMEWPGMNGFLVFQFLDTRLVLAVGKSTVRAGYLDTKSYLWSFIVFVFSPLFAFRFILYKSRRRRRLPYRSWMTIRCICWCTLSV